MGTVITDAGLPPADDTNKPADDAAPPPADDTNKPADDAPPADQNAPADDKPADDKPADDKAADDDATKGAPDTYQDFEVPEGATLSDELKEYFTQVGKSLDLNQEKAQKFVTEYFETAKANAEAGLLALDEAAREWGDQCRADKEFGGEAFDANLAFVAKARDAFVTPELRKVLDESRLGSHPEMVRLLYRVGKSLAEDKHQPGGGAHEEPKPVEALFFPSMVKQK